MSSRRRRPSSSNVLAALACGPGSAPIAARYERPYYRAMHVASVRAPVPEATARLRLCLPFHMPTVQGIFETALYVADPERTAGFYQRLFGFRRMLDSPRLIGLEVPSRQVLLLFRTGGSTGPSPTPGGVIPPHDGHGQLHIAFKIAEADVPAWVQALREAQITVESQVQSATGHGGHSIYFRDPDGHLIELASEAVWPFKA